jgi:DNA-binding winged helix-turn-helix (wHTH) protein
MEHAYSIVSVDRLPNLVTGAYTDTRLDMATRSRVRRWLHQFATKSETRGAFARLQEEGALEDIVTLLLAVPERERVAGGDEHGAWPWTPPWERFVVGDLLIDGATREVRLFGKLLTLEPIERMLLEYLVLQRARVVSREELIRYVWGGGRFRSRVVDTYVGRLRRKLEGSNVVIATIRSAGYRLVERKEASAIAEFDAVGHA